MTRPAQRTSDEGASARDESRLEEVTDLREQLARERADLRRLEGLCHVLPWERGPERSPQVRAKREYIAVIEESLRDAEAGRTTRFEKNAMAWAIREAMAPEMVRYWTDCIRHPATSVMGPVDPRTAVLTRECPPPVGPVQ